MWYIYFTIEGIHEWASAEQGTMEAASENMDNIQQSRQENGFNRTAVDISGCWPKALSKKKMKEKRKREVEKNVGGIQEKSGGVYGSVERKKKGGVRKDG